MKTNKIDNLKITKLDKSKVEISASISTEVFASFKDKAIENINNEITIDGFRKGKIPENILVKKVGEMAILEEMAELALSSIYPEIIISEKIDAIGHPEINITKLAPNNPLEFKIITTVIPEVKLGDYKKIAKEINKKGEEKINVTEKDIDDAILEIRKSRVDHSHHDHEKMTAEEHQKEIETSMPELNEDFIKSLGNFKDMADFRDKVKFSLLEDKKIRAQEKRRIALSDAILEASAVVIPELLIDSETRRIEAQFSDDITRMGVTLEDYLKHAKKTLEDLKKDWRPHAEKKAKLQLILNDVIKIEKIRVDAKEVEDEVKHILAHYKDADQEQAKTYAETVLANEKAYKFLEEQGK
jgi:FKBP-type peptidyl-prolyl cis-trans isomerase (trigger factor)